MTPRVSVLMPVFNGERFIADAVRSVLASSYGDLELLVLDDGSTDRSAAEAERAAAGDARLRIVPLPHAGVASARDAGLRAARGELVANLDADDEMFPERLERQVAYLDAHPKCVAVGSRVLAVDADGRPLRILIRTFTHDEIDAAHLDGRGGALGNPTATFRREAALRVGGYDVALHTTGEDHDFWLRMAEHGHLANLPEVLVRYRVHDANASIDTADTARRHDVTRQTLARAFARRGITDRVPEKTPPPPIGLRERLRDAALVRYYRGDRWGALPRALLALALDPASAPARAAVRTIVDAQPMRTNSNSR